MGTSVKLVFNPLCCLLMQPIFHQLFYEDLMEDSVKGLTEVQADNYQLLFSHLPGQSFHHGILSSWSSMALPW